MTKLTYIRDEPTLRDQACLNCFYYRQGACLCGTSDHYGHMLAAQHVDCEKYVWLKVEEE